MTQPKYPNKRAFKAICDREESQPLTLEDIGDVFGTPFWIMLIYAFLDSNDAARAIQNATRKLKEESKEGADGGSEKV